MVCLVSLPSENILSMLELRKKKYSKTLYRCFHTLKTSQSLLDDIGLSDAEQDVAKDFFYQNGRSESAPAQRVFERSRQVAKDISSKFKPENWSASRFCNGQWSVLYAAESQQTALKEKIYHTCRFYREESQHEAVNVDLAISKLTVQTSTLCNLVDQVGYDQAQLRSPHQKSYAYCQQVAKSCIDGGAQALRSRSARDETGYCVPVFDIQVIKKDYAIQKYIKAEIVDGMADLFYQR